MNVRRPSLVIMRTSKAFLLPRIQQGKFFLFLHTILLTIRVEIVQNQDILRTSRVIKKNLSGLTIARVSVYELLDT